MNNPTFTKYEAICILKVNHRIIKYFIYCVLSASAISIGLQICTRICKHY